LNSIETRLKKVFTAESQRSAEFSQSFSQRSSAEPQRLGGKEFALFHPTAAFNTKQWATENFASVAEFLFEKVFRLLLLRQKASAEFWKNFVKRRVFQLSFLMT
jgi:ADP-heptose:LPS heptosyltransferase